MPREESKLSWQQCASNKNKESLRQLVMLHLQGHCWGLRNINGEFGTSKALKTSQECFSTLKLT